jgi:L-methionine (R)-S-oxide reductase
MESRVDTHFLGQLIGSSQLIEQHANLEEGLTELARMTAELIRTDRCSIMLLSEPLNGEQEAHLRIFAHFGPLPPEALRQTVSMSKGIAGHVLTTRTPLLVPDIATSPFAPVARFKDSGNPSLISVPIEVASRPVGVLNVKGPNDGPRLTRKDLELITIFAMFIGKSIQTFQLQKLAESRILQMAILRERQQEAQGATPRPIAPEPARIARLVAKSLYRELTEAGFGPTAIIAVTSEVLSLLNQNLRQD